MFVHTIDMKGTHDILTRDKFGTMFVSTLASNQLNTITMRTKMTFIMTTLQVASVLLMTIETSMLAAICFAGATIGVWAAQALNK